MKINDMTRGQLAEWLADWMLVDERRHHLLFGPSGAWHRATTFGTVGPWYALRDELLAAYEKTAGSGEGPPDISGIDPKKAHIFHGGDYGVLTPTRPCRVCQNGLLHALHAEPCAACNAPWDAAWGMHRFDNAVCPACSPAAKAAD